MVYFVINIGISSRNGKCNLKSTHFLLFGLSPKYVPLTSLPPLSFTIPSRHTLFIEVEQKISRASLNFSASPCFHFLAKCFVKDSFHFYLQKSQMGRLAYLKGLCSECWAIFDFLLHDDLSLFT